MNLLCSRVEGDGEEITRITGAEGLNVTSIFQKENSNNKGDWGEGVGLWK